MDENITLPEKPETDVDVPKALVKRIVKAKLASLAGDDKEYGISKDALTALSESTKVFISLIASTANDICQEKRRSTVNADDVFNALGDLDFQELVGPLKEQLEAFKEAVRERNKNKPSKKRKNAHDAPTAVPRGPKGVVAAAAAAAAPAEPDVAADEAGLGGGDDAVATVDMGLGGHLGGGLGDDDVAEAGLLGGPEDDDGLGGLGLGLGPGEVDVEGMLVDAPP